MIENKKWAITEQDSLKADNDMIVFMFIFKILTFKEYFY
jgi:hypothetical protein